MFNISTAPSRVSQRITGARSRRKALISDRAITAQGRPSLGETLAIGLGCDRW